MENSREFLGLFVFMIMGAGIAVLMFALNSVLGPKNKSSAAKSEPFECGYNPFRAPTGHQSVKFYLIAMLFILFDVEIVWLFPWAVVLKEIKWAGIAEMFAFVAVLALGFVYAWKKGALEWEK